MADTIDRAITSRTVEAVFYVLSVAILVYIVASHIHPTRTVSASQPSVAVDPTGGPCTPDRWELACDRWRSQGWPCIVGEGPGAIAVETITLPDVRGAHRPGAIGLAANACGEDDPAPEHELGHLYDLRDGGPAGSVMADCRRLGLRIPTFVPPEAP